MIQLLQSSKYKVNMAHAHGLTREEIFNAASEIFATGKNPTQAVVRAKLGKGSFSTISKYLAEWREQQTDVEALNQSEEEMPDEARSLLKRFYGTVRAYVESTVVFDQTSTLETENENLKESLKDYEATKNELHGMRFAYSESQDRLEQTTRENERIAKYVGQIDQVEQLTEERDRLNEDLVKTREIKEQYEVANTHLKEQLESAQRNLSTSIERANSMSEELGRLTAAHSKLNTDLSNIADRNLELVEKTDLLEKSLTEKLLAIEELQNELRAASSKPASTTKTRKNRTANQTE